MRCVPFSKQVEITVSLPTGELISSSISSTQTPDEYKDTYKQLEDRSLTDKAYIAPLYISLKSTGLNQDILNNDSVRLSKSRAMAWEPIRVQGHSKNAKDPLILHAKCIRTDFP